MIGLYKFSYSLTAVQCAAGKKQRTFSSSKSLLRFPTPFRPKGASRFCSRRNFTHTHGLPTKAGTASLNNAANRGVLTPSSCRKRTGHRVSGEHAATARSSLCLWCRTCGRGGMHKIGKLVCLIVKRVWKNSTHFFIVKGEEGLRKEPIRHLR
ncbi:hypothetical protein ALCH109712_00235 [Alkalicoccus chagannorensis]